MVSLCMYISSLSKPLNYHQMMHATIVKQMDPKWPHKTLSVAQYLVSRKSCMREWIPPLNVFRFQCHLCLIAISLQIWKDLEDFIVSLRFSKGPLVIRIFHNTLQWKMMLRLGYWGKVVFWSLIAPKWIYIRIQQHNTSNLYKKLDFSNIYKT